jgi:hypothetical protein
MAFMQSKAVRTYTIDYSKCKSVDTIVNFATSGEMRPVLFRITNPDDSVITFKIESIKSIDKFFGGLFYICFIHDNEIQKEVKLLYYIEEHLWVVKIK